MGRMNKIKTNKEMIALLKCAQKKIGGPFGGFGGNCANFAEALEKTVGGKVWCVWHNKERRADELAPAHCFLKWKNNFWDADAKPKKRYELEYWAYHDDPNEVQEDVEFGPVKSIDEINELYDKERVKQFKTIFNKCVHKKSIKGAR